MRASVRFRRQPTAFERLLGKRRARRLRRRLGLASIGLGASLLRPRPSPAAVLAATAAAVLLSAALLAAGALAIA